MFLTEEDKIEIKNQLGELENEIEILLFTSKLNCQYCNETEQLIRELSETLDKVKINVYNPVLDEEISKEYGVGSELPVISARVNDNQINPANAKFLGIPAGYEFTWILSLINMISNKKYPLQANSISLVKQIDQILESNSATLELMVFVTPTCPYCPIMTINSTAIALLSKNIKALLIEVSEFPHYAQIYSVMGVPKTVFKLYKNASEKQDFIEGAMPENKFLERLLKFVETNLK